MPYSEHTLWRGQSCRTGGGGEGTEVPRATLCHIQSTPFGGASLAEQGGGGGGD